MLDSWAAEAGIAAEEWDCPPELEAGRSVCFLQDVVATHHVLEEARLEWRDASDHVDPLQVSEPAAVTHDPELARERERRQSETVLTLFQGSCRLSFAAPPPY